MEKSNEFPAGMSRRLVSVCIPCHNAEPFLPAALDSVLNQTWKDIEIIVVDDGSTDGSREVLERYKERGVRVIHEKYGSAAKSRNRAVAEAKGHYVKFFDADDLLSADFIERQMRCLQGREDAVASAAWGRFYDNDLKTFRPNPQSVWCDMESTDWLVEAWREGRPMMQPGLFLVPQAILEKCGGWDEGLTLIDDFEFFSRVLCHAKDVLFTEGAILYYRSGLSNSLSKQYSPRAVTSAFNSMLRGTGHLLKIRQDEKAKEASGAMLFQAVYLYGDIQPDLAKECYLQARLLTHKRPSFPGGRTSRLINVLFGWKFTLFVQRRIYPKLRSLLR